MIQSDFRRAIAVLFMAAIGVPAWATEHVTLKNGFELDCVRQERVGDRMRLYLAPGNGTDGKDSTENYLDVAMDAVARVEMIPDPPAITTIAPASASVEQHPAATVLTREEMHTMLAHAGTEHNIDADLLASVVRAESGGHPRAVSRVGAQGLMQLMPKTAGEMGVQDAFQPEANIAGGTAYLDQLLTRYHNNVALALAAYNAGPAAVDRYHGMPPYRETRAYVARVIREFNRRKQVSGAGEQVARAQ